MPVIGDKISPIWPNGATAALTITFDDGYADTYHETAVWLAERGLMATYYVVSRRVGIGFENLPTATWEHWRRAAQLGHEIASHGATHTSMAGVLCDIRRIFLGILSAPDRRALIRQTVLRSHALRKYKGEAGNLQDQIDPLLEPSVSRQEIKQQLPGCSVVSFSYPAGRLNRAARQAVEKAGYQSARGNEVGINRGIDSPFALRSICLGPGLALPEMEPWLLRTMDQGAWLIVTFHLVSANNAVQYPYHCSVFDFQQIIKRIEALPFWVTTQQAVIEHFKMSTPQ